MFFQVAQWLIQSDKIMCMFGLFLFDYNCSDEFGHKHFRYWLDSLVKLSTPTLTLRKIFVSYGELSYSLGDMFVGSCLACYHTHEERLNKHPEQVMHLSSSSNKLTIRICPFLCRVKLLFKIQGCLMLYLVRVQLGKLIQSWTQC